MTTQLQNFINNELVRSENNAIVNTLTWFVAAIDEGLTFENQNQKDAYLLITNLFEELGIDAKMGDDDVIIEKEDYDISLTEYNNDFLSLLINNESTFYSIFQFYLNYIVPIYDDFYDLMDDVEMKEKGEEIRIIQMILNNMKPF